MKKIFKSSVELLRSKAILAVSGGMILASCGAQVGGYTENDGVYYDPAKDTLPEGVVVDSDNQVGDVYDYSKTAVDKSKINEEQQKNKYKNWGKSSSQTSDWGNYLGTDYSYSSNYYPYSSGLSIMIIPTFGFGYGYGSMIGYGYSPYGMMGYSPYGYGMMGYSPYGYGYSPYYGMYDPYYEVYAYNPYRYGSGYGYGNAYYNSVPRKRSGSDGRMSNGMYNSGNPYRTAASTMPRQTPQYSNPRRFNNSNPYPSQPTYQNNNSYQNNGGFRSGSEGGFRSNSYNSGGFSSGSSNSGSSHSSGGFRSGGGFR